MKVVLLAGGLGTRLREETDVRPKPMVEIGGKPILWHLMKLYANSGFDDFIVCTGYKGEVIRDYFANFELNNSDFQVDLGAHGQIELLNKNDVPKWKVTVANTGLKTMTGGRIKKVAQYIDDSYFMCTYGDGLADINLNALLEFHLSHGKIATVTTVRPTSRFGLIELDHDGRVTEFSEKPQAVGNINGGFFVFNREIFDYLEEDSILEQGPLQKLVANKELMSFSHTGFWQPMDTFRESVLLNELWDANQAPWKVWN